MLVYKNDDRTTFKEIFKKYNQMGVEKYPIHQMVLGNGFVIRNWMDIREVKNLLRREDIDGMELFIDRSTRESAAICFIEQENQYFKGKIEVPFQIEEPSHFGYLRID